MHFEKLRQYINVSVRIITISVLLVSGIAKVLNPNPLIELFNAFYILPLEIVKFIVITISFFEISLGLSIVLYPKRRIVKYSVVGIFTIFLLISILGVLLGLNNECGCFGSLIESRLGITMVTRNSFLLVISVFAVKTRS